MGVCERYLTLSVLMYAGDSVIFANNAHELQKALYNLEKYCANWKLRVNCEKTKVAVFSNRRTRTDNFHFTYMGQNQEMVDCFKYLGVMFNFNGNFSRWKKELSNHGTRAMYSVIGKASGIRQYDIHVQRINTNAHIEVKTIQNEKAEQTY